ncbi:hypothetical protein E2986_10877 [Frieseomelitta varia]|uniref:Uncharacterized protein n=1 Tax=Frieseomelitta varia TaxID=561572 RepID=A0A833RV58_9HYME|nr:hypothetical protein E2986_10877 [Frieseomelitta varia]
MLPPFSRFLSESATVTAAFGRSKYNNLCIVIRVFNNINNSNSRLGGVKILAILKRRIDYEVFSDVSKLTLYNWSSSWVSFRCWVVICRLQVLQKGGSVLECPVRSLVIAILSFLLRLLFEMVCYAMYFGSICRSPNSVPKDGCFYGTNGSTFKPSPYNNIFSKIIQFYTRKKHVPIKFQIPQNEL